MEALNLNGRIVGKTADGKILVAITPLEYLESLPGVTIVGVAAEVRPVVLPPPRAEIEGEAGEFGKLGKRPAKTPKPAREKGTAPDTAKGSARCEACKRLFKQTRFDQRFCTEPSCKVARKAAYQKAYQAGRVKKPAKPTAAATKPPENPLHLTPDQKAERLAIIRKKARELGIGGQHTATAPRPPDEPAELTQANREARAE